MRKMRGGQVLGHSLDIRSANVPQDKEYLNNEIKFRGNYDPSLNVQISPILSSVKLIYHLTYLKTQTYIIDQRTLISSIAFLLSSPKELPTNNYINKNEDQFQQLRVEPLTTGQEGPLLPPTDRPHLHPHTHPHHGRSLQPVLPGQTQGKPRLHHQSANQRQESLSEHPFCFPLRDPLSTAGPGAVLQAAGDQQRLLQEGLPEQGEALPQEQHGLRRQRHPQPAHPRLRPHQEGEPAAQVPLQEAQGYQGQAQDQQDAQPNQQLGGCLGQTGECYHYWNQNIVKLA